MGENFKKKKKKKVKYFGFNVFAQPWVANCIA